MNTTHHDTQQSNSKNDKKAKTECNDDLKMSSTATGSASSMIVRYPRSFLSILFFASSILAIVQLKIGMHIFCNVDSSSHKYIIIVHDADSSECPATYETKYQSLSNNKASTTFNKNETKEMLCRGTYIILDTVSRSVSNLLPLVSNWILSSVNLQYTCSNDATTVPPPPSKKKNPIQKVITIPKGIIKGVRNIFKKKKQTSNNVDSASTISSSTTITTSSTETNLDDDWTKDVSAPLEYKLSSKQTQIIASMRTDFQNRLMEEQQISGNQDFVSRMDEARWGGSNERSFSWWYPDGRNGGSGLMTAYLKVMNWPEVGNL